MGTKTHTNYLRRGMGLLVCTSPLLLIVASFVCGLRGRGRDSPVALVMELLALFVGALNFYLSFIRPALHRRGNGSQEGYRSVSVVTILGTMLAVA